MILDHILVAQSVLEYLATQRMNVKVAYRIGKLLQNIRKEHALFEEQRVKLIKELGSEKDETWSIEPGSEAEAEFHKKIEELLLMPVELEFVPIPWGAIEHLELSANDLSGLTPFLEDADAAPEVVH